MTLKYFKGENIMKLIMSIIGACAILMVINGCGCESDDEVVALDDTTQEEVVAGQEVETTEDIEQPDLEGLEEVADTVNEEVDGETPPVEPVENTEETPKNTEDGLEEEEEATP